MRGAPGQCRAWGRFGSLSRWHPSACTGRALPDVASGRSYPPYPGATPLTLPEIRKVRRPPPASTFWVFVRFPFSIQAAPSMPAVPTYPRGFPHMPAPLSHTLPRLPQSPHADADPHRFNRLAIHFRDSPIQPPSSKNPTPVSPRPAFRSRKSRANPAPHLPRTCVSGLHISPTNRPQITQHTSAPTRPWRAQSRRDQRPACSNLRARPACSNSLRRRGGHGRQGTASLRDATTLRRRRRRQGEPEPACHGSA